MLEPPPDAPSLPPRKLPLVDGVTRLAKGPLERMQPGDLLGDYTLVPYDPVTSPAGKLRSVNVLLESFAAAGVEDLGLRVVSLLRSQLGQFRTVWGIKLRPPGEISGWELYFYDATRERPDLSIARVQEILSPALVIDARPPHPLPWHMFSVELDVRALRERTPVAVDLYIGNSRRRKGSDRSYKLRGDDLVFENVYTFHRPEIEIDEILERLRYGIHFTRRKHLLSMLWPPELLRAGHVCVANKRAADALYFSRIKLDQARYALPFFGFRGPVVDFLEAGAAGLDHLLWDIGIDFVDEGGTLRFTKGSLYGTF
jgi:hypothetical protein